jgi:hypothetical protein
MRYLYAVLLLSLACSSSEPRPSTLNQAAYRTPPRPPVFTPAEDAPHTIGQPGHLRPERQIEPNPRHKRHLPPTREPGLWAGDAPRAAADESDPAYVVANPKLFGLPVPVPDGLSPLPSGECAAKLALAAWRAGLEAMARDVPEPMRQCLIGHLMAKCTEQGIDDAKKLSKPSLHAPRWEAAHAAAVRHKTKACHVAPLDDAATTLRDRVLEQWRKNS